MAQKSAIEWTETTWNPVMGCTKLSAGCDNCYAERFAERFRGVDGHPYQTGPKDSPTIPQDTSPTRANDLQGGGVSIAGLC